jgi:AraC-like DNA-binding protein
MGIYRWVDPSDARAHIQRLRDLGWTWEQIADAAGLSTGVAHCIAAGATKHVRVESAAALLAVEPKPVDSQRGIDPTGTRRRVQALAWMGWSAEEVARRAGTTRPTLATLILPSRRISVALARRVARVYAELCMTPGPSKVAAGRARSLGFAPPLAWDDTIDDPAATPDLGEKASRTSALAENAAELVDGQGYTVEQAAERLGVRADYLRTVRRMARREAVAS